MAFHFTDTVMPSLIVAGPDGNLWFTEPTGKVGRLTTLGYLTEFTAVALPGAPTASDR
jgi:virginiamycin B lyase